MKTLWKFFLNNYKSEQYFYVAYTVRQAQTIISNVSAFSWNKCYIRSILI